MNNQRLLWFQDGIKFRTPQNTWRDIDVLTGKLVNLAGNPEFENIVIDPIKAAENLFQQIDLRNYSSIIDLSGFFGNGILKTFPKLSVIQNFHLSRMRVVSSPRLDGNGFLVSLNKDEVSELRNNIDVSKPLLLDDVSWSGRTILEAVRILEINPKKAEIGLLSGNDGDFGEGKSGAVGLLKNNGVCQITTGSIVTTPTDDGFHLTDFFSFTDAKTAFDVIINIQQLRDDARAGSDEVKKTNERRIRILLDENKTALFPNAVSTEEVKALEKDGRFINKGGISNDSLFDINPPNWLMPSFSIRTNTDLLKKNRDGIIDVLREFRDIIDDVPNEGREQRREILEQRFGGKERL